ncbi:ComEA family DNA-binding protein [Cellulomonas sp. S1-8]|uniref:ComEA family DNA-binding protein n=1 Tax=Cellulomonas sp. S1-8 TaxID=2904790 RepID=UPI0022434031|nr:ComEA family DNA-binding protein [Cellulomonas sp. S1-8]UZN01816.1 ComEA family DNA-binding protein [Cellulomonas sp. S1-8]
MPPLDRSRTAPDVARRLVALAAHRAGDDPVPAPAVLAPDPTVPTPDPTAPSPAPPPGWTPRGPAPREPAPDALAAPWDPSVTTALTAAAATVPVAPTPRVRWVPGWRAAGTAVLLLALVAGGVALRSAAAPQGEPVALPTPAVAGRVTGDAADPADELVVHVVGAVADPGVVRLPLGSRVAEAVAAAGGSTPEADLAGVNLARVLTDGEQLVLPQVGAAPAAVVGPPQDALVDLNTADAVTLEALPGVGPVLAARIVEHRAGSPFTTVDELDDVSGIGPALLAELRPRVRV